MDLVPFVLPYFRRRDGRSLRARGGLSYTPPQVARAYGVPQGATAVGQTVGIIELGGAFSQASYNQFMQGLGLTPSPVQVVSVAGGAQKSDPGGADTEVMLDVEIVAAVAVGCTIKLYFAPNSDAGFAAAAEQAVAECDVVSISWGGPESSWPPTARNRMDRAFVNGNTRGVSSYAAAGDNGSGDGVRGNNVDYPASSPGSIGCGGTRLVASGDVITTETVWNDGTRGGSTGGGFSKAYAIPGYQQGHLPVGSTRGVPDVAALADPETGWQVSGGVVGGTSAAAPFWAAVNALLNKHAGRRVGGNELFTLLYGHPEVFFDTLTGSNGAFSAGPGWDACTGLGTPKVSKLFELVNPVVVIPPPPPPPPVGRTVTLSTDLKAGTYTLIGP